MHCRLKLFIILMVNALLRTLIHVSTRFICVLCKVLYNTILYGSYGFTVVRFTVYVIAAL